MKKYYHGTIYNFPKNFNLKPLGYYTNLKEIEELENLFENCRPKNKISRKKCIFLAENIDDIDNLGGYTDAIYFVESKFVDKSDLAWYTEAQIFLEEKNINKATECVYHYWNGDVFYNKDYSCIELRTISAKVVDLVELNV